MRIWVGTREGGSILPNDEARVSVLDHAFTVGDGVFETLKVTPAGPFAVSRHLRRLAASATGLGMNPPDDAVIRRAVSELLGDDNGGVGDLGRLRITYTGGTGPLGSDRGDAVPGLVVAVSPTTPWAPTTSVATVPWTRNENSAVAGVKTTSYAENVVALSYAHGLGASEATFANTKGELCEGTGTNVFVVIDGQVLTPWLSSGCLAGITRELLLEWADVQEASLPIDVLDEADEVFLTSSTRNVHPVTRVNHRTWPAAGRISSAVAAAFDANEKRGIDP